jgi:hypothetical protein
MMQSLRLQGIAQRLDHMRLPDHFGKIPGAVLAGQNEVGHASILKRAPGAAGPTGRPEPPAIGLRVTAVGSIPDEPASALQ